MLILELSNLEFSVGNRTILADVNARFSGGQMISILGRNGAGKTTLIKTIAGIVKGQGEIALTEDGTSLNRTSIAYVPQLESVHSTLSGFETVLLGLCHSLTWRVQDEQLNRVKTILEELNLQALADKPMNEMSGGQKQMIYLAQAFVSAPRVLLLDEPTSALDLRHQLVIMQTVKDYCQRTGAIVIFVMHDLVLASRFCDQVLFLHKGVVHAIDEPEKVVTSRTIDPIYQIESIIETNRQGYMTLTPVKPL